MGMVKICLCLCCPAATVMRALKQALDPFNILNPGKVISVDPVASNGTVQSEATGRAGGLRKAPEGANRCGGGQLRNPNLKILNK